MTQEETTELEKQIEEVKSRILTYNENILRGTIPSNKWVYAAARRMENDLQRTDLDFDWRQATDISRFYESLSLVGEWSGQNFKLQDWQLYAVCNIMCWKWKETGLRRHRLAVLQVGRGAGKTTVMAGLCLYELQSGMGKYVHNIANNINQAEILLDAAKTMVGRLPEGHDFNIRYTSIDRDDADCHMTSLPALERALDGLSPSLWCGDECAEYRNRFLTKLLTTGVKRKETTGILITTPGSNSENQYAEIVKTCEGILTGEITDDNTYALLYGLDHNDVIDDESVWSKANPGLEYGQPHISSLRRSWNTMRSSVLGRAEFNRYHCCRFDEYSGGWLDMEKWDQMSEPYDPEILNGRICYAGLDLSKTQDMTALVFVFPNDDGTCYVKGEYWFPSDGLAQRELDYRLPVRTWYKEGKLNLCPGRQIDYEMIRVALNEARKKYDLKVVAYDAWGSSYLAEALMNDGIPLQTYKMSISTFAPGCQLFQHYWLGNKLRFGNDPIMKRAAAECYAKRDINGNIRPVKGREHAIIDPIVACIMALHAYGGKQSSMYEIEADIINGEQ
jgi:phage terminase large subunit-like protein